MKLDLSQCEIHDRTGNIDLLIFYLDLNLRIGKNIFSVDFYLNTEQPILNTAFSFLLS